MALNGRIVDQSQTGTWPVPGAWITVPPTLAALAFLVALPPLEVAAGLVAGGIVLVWAFINPMVALAGLVLVLPVSTTITVDAGDFSVTAIEPLMLLLVLAWLARGIAKRDLVVVGGPLLVALGLVLLAVLTSGLAAERPGLAYKETIKWLELLVVFLFTLGHLTTISRQRAILAVLLFAGTAEALYGIWQYLSGEGPSEFTVGEALRAYGNFEQPNPFAGYLATILPLAVVLAARRNPPTLAVLAAATVLSTGAGILLSLSRGAWVAVALALAAMLAAWSPMTRRWLPPIGGAVVLLVLLTANNVLPGSWSDRLVAVVENFGVFDVRTVEVTGANFAVVERMAHWQAGWYMLLDHPAFGVGAGNYPVAYENYYLPGWRDALGHAHNYYLNMAAETGLPGMAALIALLAVIYGTILGGLKRQPAGTFNRALLVGLLGSIVVLTVHNLFDNLLVHGMPVQVGLFMGLVALAAGPTVPIAPVSSRVKLSTPDQNQARPTSNQWPL